jgi:Domain of unknown function (DUF397).
VNHQGERALMDLSRAVWRKSSRSNGTGGDCVEVAVVSGNKPMIAIRDSKNPRGGVLAVSTGDWRAFVAGIKRGDYND